MVHEQLPGEDQDEAPSIAPAVFQYPCERYLVGMRGKGNFGAYIDPRWSRSPFAGSYHLAEDIWLDGGTKVRSVADGRVVYSDFSPTWTDQEGTCTGTSSTAHGTSAGPAARTGTWSRARSS